MYGDRMKTYPYLIAVLLAFFTGQVLAEADGPDFYKVPFLRPSSLIHRAFRRRSWPEASAMTGSNGMAW